MSITKHLAVQATKTSNLNSPKSLFSLSDVNRQYRKQQNYKKKLKSLAQTNSLLEQRIKIFESTINDQRSSILFQLNQLSKTMNNKVSTYLEQKLDKDKFSDNQKALQTIKQMIIKFQTVEKQTRVTKKVYQSLNSIHQRYLAYSQEIDALVKLTEKSNKQYEDGMKNMLDQKQSQIYNKRQQNQDIYDETQTMIKKIDDFEAGKLKLLQEQKELQQEIKKLKQIENSTKKQVQKFTQWAHIVIDKNHRKVFNKQTKQKDAELSDLSSTNKSLQIYLRQLENEQFLVQSQIKEKQNEIKELRAPKKVKSIKPKNTKR